MANNNANVVLPVISTIFCKTQFEGIHFYEGAPDPVSYLKSAHRHVFGVQVELQVYDDDREIEFIMLKHKINQWLNQRCVEGVWPMAGRSCEMVAKELADAIANEFGIDFPKSRKFSVTVDEDGENGASFAGAIFRSHVVSEDDAENEDGMEEHNDEVQ